MTQSEMQAAAKAFAENWAGRGDEKQETSRFWIGLLAEVLGVRNPQNYIEFEKRVKLSHTSFIDAYIPETKVLIEQKGIKIDLDKMQEQSDGALLTPYQQAKRYADEMPYNLRPRWIVVSNFAEIHVHDMNRPDSPPEVIYLKDLEKDFYRLEFLVDRKNENIRREEEISIAAGKLVGKMYDALITEYINPTAESYRSLNVLCVRLVFCFYAEDAGLFETRTSFEDYIKSFNLPNVRVGLIKLFKALDTKLENRDKYDDSLKPFPYVNGGLFHDENIEIPNFTEEIVDVLVKDCAPFDWHEISPTIFGAVFESTLNPDTRRKGGMHYTSIENIHRLIDPLFLDELNEEFDEIIGIRNQGLGNRGQGKQLAAALIAFQEKLGSLTFLDPACGSGNFLTETYLSLRRLENKVISALNKGEKALGFDEFIHVRISQFYGIEINDFAVTVAKTALWIAESQMIGETEKILGQQIDFLPLKTNAYIVEGNALRMDWATLTNLDGTKSEQPMLFDAVVEPLPVGRQVVARRHERSEVTTSNGNGHFDKLNHPDVAVTEPVEVQSPHHYDYIMGNPPFVGKSYQSKEQKEDMALVFDGVQGYGNLDFVTCWYKKACDLIQGSDTRCAFVSTNSICQGIAVPPLWSYLFAHNIEIDFAYRTFKWTNETADKGQMAAVHCVIIGFSGQWSVKSDQLKAEQGGESGEWLVSSGQIRAGQGKRERHPELVSGSAKGGCLRALRDDVAQPPHQKFIIDENGEKHFAQNINAYLLDAPNIIVENRLKPLCNVPEMIVGSCPTDGGGFILTEEEKEELVKKEPQSQKYIKKYIGSEEFINKKTRWCLWLKDCPPDELNKMPLVMERIKSVRDFRLASKKEQTRRRATTPMLFAEDRFVPSKAIFMPMVSSENRDYIPIGFIDAETVANNKSLFIPNGDLVLFGILTSKVHNDWMRVTAGRLESRYSYGTSTVYNTFPFPDFSESQKEKISKTAQSILDARAKFPNASLADLYNPLTMPPELRKAHEANDRAVMQAYGFDKSASESEIVAELFKLYQKLCASFTK